MISIKPFSAGLAGNTLLLTSNFGYAAPIHQSPFHVLLGAISSASSKSPTMGAALVRRSRGSPPGISTALS
jgi:hypothetical protein